MITVAQMIELLKKYPPDMPVIRICDADGGGYETLEEAKIIKVSQFASGGGSYYGELTEYEAGKENLTYKTVWSGDKEFQMFKAHFEALLID